MNKEPETRRSIVVIIEESSSTLKTRYAGALAFKGAWQRFSTNNLLSLAGIYYGQDINKAPDMAFGLTLGPLVGAASILKVAQRFGGEPSKEKLEEDLLLTSLIKNTFTQRQLDRFMTHPRHNWQGFQRQRIRQLQEIEGFQFDSQGVLILDDFPLPKPYAREMDYLTPVWDNNLKRSVRGYSMVHLYYYHPQNHSYSLYIEPWLKTSLTGETIPKPKQARRRAKPGEERSKLDIALDAIEFL